MEDKRIGELPSVPYVNADTLLAAEQQGQAVKITAAQLVGSSGSGGGGGGGVTSFNGRVGAVLPLAGDYTPDMVGAVPTSRTINGKPLTGNITLTAEDLGINSGSDYTGGGFVEMQTSIPTAQRKGNTLYGLILETYS